MNDLCSLINPKPRKYEVLRLNVSAAKFVSQIAERATEGHLKVSCEGGTIPKGRRGRVLLSLEWRGNHLREAETPRRAERS